MYRKLSFPASLCLVAAFAVAATCIAQEGKPVPVDTSAEESASLQQQLLDT